MNMLKYKVTAMFVAAIGDSALQIFATKIGDPVSMVKILYNRFASSRTATKIPELTSMYTERFQNDRDAISTYVDEFETMFTQLERMGSETAIPGPHKAPLILENMGGFLPLVSTVVALRRKGTDMLTCENVTSDLIQKFNSIQSRHTTERNHMA